MSLQIDGNDGQRHRYRQSDCTNDSPDVHRVSLRIGLSLKISRTARLSIVPTDFQLAGRLGNTQRLRAPLARATKGHDSKWTLKFGRGGG
jgi:hypothetical protein